MSSVSGDQSQVRMYTSSFLAQPQCPSEQEKFKRICTEARRIHGETSSTTSCGHRFSDPGSAWILEKVSLTGPEMLTGTACFVHKEKDPVS